MSGKVTMKELSKSLNLSVSTISKALNNSPEISEATVNKVKEFAALNNYIPNMAARNLKVGQCKTIGVVLPTISTPFFSSVLEGIESLAVSNGYRIILCLSNELLEKEKASIQKLLETQIDGLIISPSRETKKSNDVGHLSKLKAFKIPVVTFDRRVGDIDCDTITTDEELKAELAIFNLERAGCNKIIFLADTLDLAIYDSRKIGYENAMLSLGLHPMIIEYQNRFPNKHLKRLLESKSIDGILACTEQSAIEVMSFILKNGFSIPHDVSVIGFNNSSLGKTFWPSLSSIDLKPKEQGNLAIETLMDRINGLLPVGNINYQLHSEIIQRQSTRTFF
ncbi:LacI family DNA-binding transcriptional regulator [Gramella sp. AN32]|uniref:LacI family DNA-binding transcriptional regulator n=1 Tax=Christiangramia antarctica TaxID=2058158 RepID=A0ABW5X6T3_9FLAO|nr:LacI family DNA-binding transcriptional regulator [Gramella sp. AN32]MCM4157808.1 LacI family transcriptional regulator [Gramella sp. AN32]